MTKKPESDEEFAKVVARLEKARKNFLPPPERVRRAVPNPHLALAPLNPDDPYPPPNAIVDWRTQGVIGPAGFQGECASCASFAVAAAIEAHRRILNHADHAEVDAGFLHTCIAHGGLVLDPALNCREGADLGPLLQQVVAHGYALKPPGSPYPYPPGACHALPVQHLAPPRILPGPNAMKNAILRGPVAIEIYVGENFSAYQGQTPVYIPDVAPGGYWHSVCVIGYQPNGWLIKNSMGDLWGVQGGFAVLPYGACALFGPPAPTGSNGIAFEIALPAGAIA